MIILKSPREIELMAKAGYVTAGALQVVKKLFSGYLPGNWTD